jgi:hypothetical protein
MNPKIIKAILDNGDILELGNVNPITSEDYRDWKKRRVWEKQFEEFEEKILENLLEDNIEKYAKNHLNLIDEDDCDDCDDCDCDDLSDATNFELISEIHRRMSNQKTIDIVSSDLFLRFSNLLSKADFYEIDSLITQLESKNKIL